MYRNMRKHMVGVEHARRARRLVERWQGAGCVLRRAERQTDRPMWTLWRRSEHVGSEVRLQISREATGGRPRAKQRTAGAMREGQGAIPIVSHLLCEAKGIRITLTVTDQELNIGTLCEAKVKKEAPALLELVR